uniref:Uncharacterized protein n=1 Tax=Globodera pallida TaxID=36090 RepID=A0A183C3U6_GLOPA
MNPAVPALQKAGVDVYAGVPSEEIIKQMPKPLLLILDDLMLNIEERYLSDLFTKKSHHHNFAVVFVTQNLFDRKIKAARMSAQYLVLMRAPNSLLSIRNIGVQLFPRQLDFFLDAYRKATARPYGYLLIDMHAASDPMLRLRTNIFKEEQEEDEGIGLSVLVKRGGEEEETEVVDTPQPPARRITQTPRRVVNTPPQPPTIHPSVAMGGTSQGRPVRYAQRKRTQQQQQQQAQASPPVRDRPNFVFMDSSNEKEAGDGHQRSISNGTPLPTAKMELVLDSLYNDPSSPAAFAGMYKWIWRTFRHFPDTIVAIDIFSWR